MTAPIGNCPESFTDAQKQSWADLVGCSPAGVLTRADRLAVEEAARALALSREGKADTATRRLLQGYLGRFGMTPSDRSKVSAPKTAPVNPFTALREA